MLMLDPFGSAATLGGAFAALAAVLPEKIGDGAKGLVVGAVVGELALTSNGDEPRVHKPIEVVTQGRPRDVEPLLQLGRRDALGPGLDDSAQERQAGDVPQRGELLGVPLHL